LRTALIIRTKWKEKSKKVDGPIMCRCKCWAGGSEGGEVGLEVKGKCKAVSDLTGHYNFGALNHIILRNPFILPPTLIVIFVIRSF
jgi:hypothetical protein